MSTTTAGSQYHREVFSSQAAGESRGARRGRTSRAVGLHVLACVGVLTVIGFQALAPGVARASRRRAEGPSVAVYITSANGRLHLTRLPDVNFGPLLDGGSSSIAVNAAVRYQALTAGFGVAMTDTSAWLLHEWLSPDLRNRLMRALFSRTNGGIGLSYLRVPIGGSDYVVGAPYTYDDLPPGQSDPSLRHFSIAHDQAYILPVIRTALIINPQLTIMANPWSPPAWMKTDDSLIPTGPRTSTLRPDARSALAQYLVRFLQAYRASGVPVQQLGVQNEPLNTLATQSFPQMYLSAQDEGTFITDYLTPALRDAGLSPQVLAWDYVYPWGLLELSPETLAYVPTVMQQAGHDISGLALHCYLTDAQAGTFLHNAYPQAAQYETECSSYLSDIEPQQMAIRVLRNWAQGVQLWNLALDQDFGPKVGQGCQGLVGPHAGDQCIAPVIVDRTAHTYALTTDYWALGQFSRFIRLGARRIDSSTPNTCSDGWAFPPAPCGPEDVAFANPDGSRVLVVTTDDGKPHTITVSEEHQSFTYQLNDGDTATFVWRR